MWLTLVVSSGIADGNPEHYRQPKPPWAAGDAEMVTQAEKILAKKSLI